MIELPDGPSLGLLIVDFTDQIEEVFRNSAQRVNVELIIEVTALAAKRKLPIFAAELIGTTKDAGPVAASVRKHVRDENRFIKSEYSAFHRSCGFGAAFRTSRCQRLLVMGFDRDICVRKTAIDGAAYGHKTVTSEACSLAGHGDAMRNLTLTQLRDFTDYLETADDVRSCVRGAGRKAPGRRRR